MAKDLVKAEVFDVVAVRSGIVTIEQASHELKSLLPSSGRDFYEINSITTTSNSMICLFDAAYEARGADRFDINARVSSRLDGSAGWEVLYVPAKCDSRNKIDQLTDISE